MENLSSFFKAAAQIKSAKRSKEKREFDSLPEYRQYTLYCADLVKNVRKQQYKVRKIAYECLKSKGLEKLKDNKYIEAHYLFCKSISIFKYITSKNKRWNVEGIRDIELTYHEDSGSNSEEANEIRKMIISSLLNISLCDLKEKKYEEVRKTCNDVIKMDNKNIKAYYRRAFSYFLCKTSLLDDIITGCKDLETILLIEDNKEIRKEFDQIKLYIQEQKIGQKKFNLGLFNNISSSSSYIYQNNNENICQANTSKTTSDTTVEENKYDEQAIVQDKHNSYKQRNTNIPETLQDNCKEDNSFGRSELNILKMIISQCKVLMKSYYKGRQVREYFSTKTILERAEMYYENLTKLLSIDFDNPDDGLKEFAIKNNLDLKDDSFKNIMHKYKINYLDKVNNFYEETVCFNDDSDSQSNLDGMEYDNYEQAEEDEDSALEKKKKKQKSKNKKTKKKTFKEASTNEDDEGFAKQESSCNYKDDDTEIIKIKKNIIKKKLVKSSDTIGKKVTKQNVFLQLFYIIISLTMLCLSLMFLCIYYDVN